MVRLTIPAVVCFLASPTAFAQPPEDAALLDHIASLESRIARLRAAESGEAWLTDARATELRALVADVLADADSRSSLLQEGSATAGWDGHPFLASGGADGNFRLELEGRTQYRYILNRQDDEAEDAGGDTTRAGFEARRVRTIFSGHVVDPSITYKVQATFNRGGGAFILEDAFIQKDFENGVYLRGGQFRPPLTREAIVSTFRTTTVERSIAHGAIELARTQGIEIGWSNDTVGLRGSFHDGDAGQNTSALARDTEFAISGRAEWIAVGEAPWKQFNDFTGWRGDSFGLLLGAGALYQRGEFGSPGDPDRADDFRWTLDAQMEFSGAHVFASVGGREVDSDSGAADADILIATIEGGVFVTDDVEAFARFEWGDDDSEDDLLVLTLGATRFWKKHDVKWTTDIGYGFDAVSATFASSGAGWREDASGLGSDGQIVLRTQLQLCF
jgi:hypothetical protein